MTTTSDPWKDLKPPEDSVQVTARRIDPAMPWNFFWGRATDGRYLLLLRHAAEASRERALPALRGIELVDSTGDDPMLIWALEDPAQRDIFHRLCSDIIDGSSGAASEKEAVAVAIARTWRWHHLLRGGSDGRLSAEQQKGLIGELVFLERYLLTLLPTSDAISSWHGPLDAPKDFEVAKLAIEAKARRGAAAPYVSISSEFQLDTSGVDKLYLYVIELAQAPEEAEGAFTVTDVAERVRQLVNAEDSGSLEPLESLLEAVGFQWTDDYSDSSWVEGNSRFFDVRPEFPRVAAPELRSGVSDLQYSISLHECEPFAVDAADVLAALKEASTHAS
jgi:hypothetical protein